MAAREKTTRRKPATRPVPTRPGELKARLGLYVAPDCPDRLDAILADLPGVSSRGGAVEYLIGLYETRKADRSARGLKGPVPIHG